MTEHFCNSVRSESLCSISHFFSDRSISIILCIFNMYNYECIIYSGFSGGPCPALDTWKFIGESEEWVHLNDGPLPSTFAAMKMTTKNFKKCCFIIL